MPVQEVILERRRKVRRFMLMGIPTHKIAETLDVGTATVDRDIIKIRGALSQEFKEFKSREVNRWFATNQMLIDELWKEWIGCKEKREKAMFMRELRGAMNDRIEKMQSLGILQKEIGNVSVSQGQNLLDVDRILQIAQESNKK